jgi:cytochrome c oxidase subunit 4
MNEREDREGSKKEGATRITGGVLTATFVALMLLAVLSFLLSYAHLGRFAAPVALVIAVAKASLVALFFMELVAERFTIRIVLVTAVAWVFLLMGFMVADIRTRQIPPVGSPTTPGRTDF